MHIQICHHLRCFSFYYCCCHHYVLLPHSLLLSSDELNPQSIATMSTGISHPPRRSHAAPPRKATSSPHPAQQQQLSQRMRVSDHPPAAHHSAHVSIIVPEIPGHPLLNYFINKPHLTLQIDFITHTHPKSHPHIPQFLDPMEQHQVFLVFPLQHPPA